MVELLQIRLEEAKEGMVVCPPSELPRLQGAAIALDALLGVLTIPPVVIKKDAPIPQPDTIELWP